MNKQNNSSKGTQTNDTQAKGTRLSTIRGRVTQANTTEYCLVDAKTIQLALSCVQAVGGAIVFGGTRDGGALVITVLVGNENEKFYCKNASECNDTLNDIVLALKPDIIEPVFAHIREAIGIE